LNGTASNSLDSLAERIDLAVRDAPPLVMLLTNSFREMLMHFMCNLRKVAPTLLRSLVIVAADRAMFAFLMSIAADWQLGGALPLDAELFSRDEKESANTVQFGTLTYFELILVRAKLAASLMARNRTFMIVEPDVTVREDFVRSFSEQAERSNADIIGVQEFAQSTNLYANGGFLYLTSNERVLLTWQQVVNTFERSMKRAREMHANGEVISLRNELESDVLARIVNRDDNARLAVMDRNRYLSGMALTPASSTQSTRDARVVLLNHVIGNEKKRVRAITHSLWHLNEDLMCM
jgi:hypothetical protein